MLLCARLRSRSERLNLAGWTKKPTGRPTITVGSVGLDGDFIRGFMGEGAPLHGRPAPTSWSGISAQTPTNSERAVVPPRSGGPLGTSR